MEEILISEVAEQELLNLIAQEEQLPTVPHSDAIAENKDIKSINDLRPSWQSRFLKIALFIAASPFIAILIIIVMLLWVLLIFFRNTVALYESLKNNNKFKFEFVCPFPAGTVDSVGALRIVIYTNDHDPPHFHILTDNYNAKFCIDSCEHLGGELPKRHLKAVKHWHAANIDLLREKWALSRPRAL